MPPACFACILTGGSLAPILTLLAHCGTAIIFCPAAGRIWPCGSQPICDSHGSISEQDCGCVTQ